MDGPPDDTVADTALRARLERLRDALASGLIERAIPARLALLAALAGEHLLLLGPPGTAKSELARRLRSVLRDASYFERLLTRFSVPEELFGPLSIKALERDEYLRLTDAYLPCATVAFLDEIFKANSAILNALLTLLNEREFDNGPRRVRTPLACVVAASNELPEGPELGALYDRFLLRFRVEPVSRDGFDELLELPDTREAPPTELTLTPEELAEIHRGAREVTLGPHTRRMLGALRGFLAERGVYVSDRRWRKIAALLRTSAHTEGRREVTVVDTWLIEHCAWDKPEQRAVVREWLDARLAEATGAEPERLATIVATHEQALEAHRKARTQRTDAKGHALYLGDDRIELVTSPRRRTRRTTAEGELLYLTPPGARAKPGVTLREDYTIRELFDRFFPDDLRGLERYVADPTHEAWSEVAREPAMEPERVPNEYVDSMVAQAEELERDVQRELEHAQAVLGSLASIEGPLWLPLDQYEQARKAISGAVDALSMLGPRLRLVREGYLALPRAMLR